MKKLFSLLLLGITVICVSCSDDDYIPVPPEVAIENMSGKTAIPQGESLSFRANLKSVLTSSFKWMLNGAQVSTDSTYVFTTDAIGDYAIMLICENADGEESAAIDITVYGKYKNGLFVLNEGNMSNETGSLIFINPAGEVTENAYFSVNNISLGNVMQDMFIGDGKMYLIAQNGKSNTINSEGKLVVANAETLEKEASYDDELSSLSWPTHIAVLGDNAFIRDGNGVHLFNTTTKSISLVNGTKGALKNRMAVANNNVFVPASKSVLVLQAGLNEVAHKIEFDATVSGVIKASDGNIWISTTGSPHKIAKVSSTDYSVIQINEMPADVKLGAGSGATPGISAKGDTLYFSNASTKIYRHIFSKNQTDYMVDVKELDEDATIVYNNLGVHPVTGEVYFTSIKAYSTYNETNAISVINFEGEKPVLSANYKNYTRFPAGVFFTDSFK